MHLSLKEVIIYTLHITIAREFLQELSSKSLWLDVDNFVDSVFTVVYQGLSKIIPFVLPVFSSRSTPGQLQP